MIGLTSLDVCNSVFNRTKENNKFEIYKFPEEKIRSVSYEKVGDEIENDLGISNITAVDLPDDTLGPIIIDEYRDQVTKE